jgi:hypothetical protein
MQPCNHATMHPCQEVRGEASPHRQHFEELTRRRLCARAGTGEASAHRQQSQSQTGFRVWRAGGNLAADASPSAIRP